MLYVILVVVEVLHSIGCCLTRDCVTQRIPRTNINIDYILNHRHNHAYIHVLNS